MSGCPAWSTSYSGVSCNTLRVVNYPSEDIDSRSLNLVIRSRKLRTEVTVAARRTATQLHRQIDACTQPVIPQLETRGGRADNTSVISLTGLPHQT